jgi:WD40 repeat protein
MLRPYVSAAQGALDAATMSGLWHDTRIIANHSGAVTSAAFSPDGRMLVVAAGDRAARVLEAATDREISVLRGHASGITSAAFSPDGSRIVTVSSDATARLWDITTGRETVALKGHAKPVTDAPSAATAAAS